VSKDIQEIYKIQKILEENNYFDISRIASEIYTFSTEKNIPLENIFERINSNEPWEYISGETEFCNNKFILTKDTLIPRIETEDLVNTGYKEFSTNKNYSSIYDIGTGSGCIAISICKKIMDHDIQIVATDISEKAIEVAKRNAILNEVEDMIEFVNTDLIDSVEIRSNTLLLANLPYIPTTMYLSLDKSVKEFEPETALDGKDDGLFYYKKLFNQLEEKIHNKKNITLIVEIEPSTITNFKEISKKYSLDIKKDFREKDRFVLIHLC